MTVDFLRTASFKRAAKAFLAGIVLASGLIVHAPADELLMGLVTKVYRANSKIGVQLQKNGVPAGPVVDFDVLDGLPFDEVEPGDRLRFSAEQIGGVWTITRFQRQ